MRSVGYKVVLPAVAAFGIGFLAHMYFSEKPGIQKHSGGEAGREHPLGEESEGEDRRKVTLKIEKRNWTIEEMVGHETDIIYCTEEDIKVTEKLFGKTPK